MAPWITRALPRLLDAGSTPRGLPYIVMERVDGHAIDLYCREEGLSIADRLKLLVQVCEAVEAAHRALIVHRDLKPSPAMRAVAICDQEPRSLSSTVRALSDAKKERLASQLQQTVSRLPAALSGDLDAIALKALQKEPNRR